MEEVLGEFRIHLNERFEIRAIGGTEPQLIEAIVGLLFELLQFVFVDGREMRGIYEHSDFASAEEFRRATRELAGDVGTAGPGNLVGLFGVQDPFALY